MVKSIDQPDQSPRTGVLIVEEEARTPCETGRQGGHPKMRNVVSPNEFPSPGRRENLDGDQLNCRYFSVIFYDFE